MNSRCASSKKKTSLGLGRSPTSGSRSKSSTEQPEQQRRVDLGRHHELVGGEDVDVAAALGVGLHEVEEVERGLAEELLPALLLEREQRALDGADGGGGDVAVGGADLGRVVGDVLEDGAQVVEVEQQEAVVVGDAEGDREHGLLDVVEVEHAREQQRPDLGRGGAHRVALLAEHVPEHRPASPRTRQGARPSCATRSSTLALPPPGCETPERSPLMSAAKTGTPARLNASARTCRVTVLPVPVAPATSPCRLAICGSRYRSAAFLAISRPSACRSRRAPSPGRDLAQEHTRDGRAHPLASATWRPASSPMASARPCSRTDTAGTIQWTIGASKLKVIGGRVVPAISPTLPAGGA